MNLRDFLGIIRAPFLILAPMCSLLGLATAYQQDAPLTPLNIFLAFFGGILAHISVNSLNEYFDFKSGLDLKTLKTPFSGGSGTLVKKPHLKKHALIIGLSAMVITFFIGIYFIYQRGIEMLLIGILGVIIVLLYPTIFVKSPLLSLISPGLGFGTSMVLGTHIALGGVAGLKEVLASLVPFFLVNNLLLLNQFPDKEADESVGRKNIVILWGRKRASFIYLIFNTLAYICIILGIVIGYFGIFSALSLLTIIFAILASIKAIRKPNDLNSLLPAQVLNVVINLLTPFLLAIGLIL